MKKVKVLKYSYCHSPIRVMIINGETYFAFDDIANILGLEKAWINYLNPCHVLKVNIDNSNKLENIISLNALYTLHGIVRDKNEITKEFGNFVEDEILETIWR